MLELVDHKKRKKKQLVAIKLMLLIKREKRTSLCGFFFAFMEMWIAYILVTY